MTVMIFFSHHSWSECTKKRKEKMEGLVEKREDGGVHAGAKLLDQVAKLEEVSLNKELMLGLLKVNAMGQNEQILAILELFMAQKEVIYGKKDLQSNHFGVFMDFLADVTDPNAKLRDLVGASVLGEEAAHIFCYDLGTCSSVCEIFLRMALWNFLRDKVEVIIMRPEEGNLLGKGIGSTFFFDFGVSEYLLMKNMSEKRKKLIGALSFGFKQAKADIIRYKRGAGDYMKELCKKFLDVSHMEEGEAFAPELDSIAHFVYYLYTAEVGSPLYPLLEYIAQKENFDELAEEFFCYLEAEQDYPLQHKVVITGLTASYYRNFVEAGRTKRKSNYEYAERKKREKQDGAKALLLPETTLPQRVPMPDLQQQQTRDSQDDPLHFTPKRKKF